MSDPIRLRQICILVPALEPVIDQLIAVFGLQVCYGKADLTKYGVPFVPPPPHQAAFFQQHGLASALLPVGETFLELVAPIRADTPASRYLERRGAGGYMVITEVGDLAPFRSRIERENARLAGQVDYPAYNELQLDPRDVGASMLSFSQQKEGTPFDGGWYPAGPAWRERAANGFGAIRRAVISARDPEAVAAKWSSLIGRPAAAHDGGVVIALDGAEIRFVPSVNGADRLSAIEVEMADFTGALARADAAGLATEHGSIVIGGLTIGESATWG